MNAILNPFVDAMTDKLLDPQNMDVWAKKVAKEVVNEMKRRREDLVKSKEYLTGKEVDAFLKISAVTRHKYAKNGILTKHKIGGRVLYRREDVEKALIAMEAKRA